MFPGDFDAIPGEWTPKYNAPYHTTQELHIILLEL
jgi:hypothetical protein